MPLPLPLIGKRILHEHDLSRHPELTVTGDVRDSVCNF